MIRKLLFLFALCVTTIGAWAGETILIDAGDGVIPTTDNFKLEAGDTKAANMQVGDLLRIYYRNDADSHFYCGFYPISGSFLFSIDDNNGDKRSTSAWVYKEITLDATTITTIQENGLVANRDTWAQNVTLQKLTFVHYADATGVSLNKNNITIGIGNTDNTLKAIVAPEGEANQTVDWSVVSGGESFVSVDANGVITGLAAGDACVRATVPGTSYYADCFVKVQKGFTLSLSADKTTVLNTVGGTVNITPTVSLEGESPVEDEDYDIKYTIRNNPDPTHVTKEGKVLTIATGATAGTYTIDAELTSISADYAGATASIDIVVDAPLTDAMHFEIDNQTFGKSQGTSKVEGILKIDNSTFANLMTHNFSASSDNESVVTASWKTGTANEHNNTIVFTVNGVGEAHVTLTDEVTNSAGKVAFATKTITVNVTGDPLHFTMGSLTVNDDQTLSVDAIKAAITKVYTEANSTQIDVDPVNYEVEVYKDDAKVETSIPAQGSGVNSFNITVKVNATNENYTDAEQQVVPVTVTHKKSFILNLDNIDKTTIKANIHETATIIPSAKYNEEDVEIAEYTCVSSDPTVATAEVVDGKIVVTAQKQGSVTINVTATPTDTENYATIQATSAEITVTQALVTITKETIGDKEFVVVNVPEGGAFGEIDDNPAVSSSSIANAVEELKTAVNVKVVGNIANSDVQEIVNLIGVTTVDAGYCKIFDMGDATMTEAITNDGYKCSFVNSTNSKSLVSVESIVLPKPATDVVGGTILTKGMSGLHGLWNNVTDNHLQSLTIPEGWTEVADEAWASNNNNTPVLGGTSISLQNLTTLNLPNSLEKVGDWAFSGLGVKVLYMPKEIAYIGAAAFSNSPNMSDIYFTADGTKLKYVDQDAFSHQTQMVNNCVENDNVCNGEHMPTMDRSHYVNGGVLACVLHFPDGCEAEYTDVTRKYKVIDTSASDNAYMKGGIGSSYIPDGWTTEFVNAVNAASKNENIMTITADPLMVSGGFPDVTYGNTFVWPSQYQMTSGYAIANAGYLWNGQPMSKDQLDPENGIDKRGLYQFIVALWNAPEDQVEWNFKYEQNEWYTISLPFDMSVDEIKKVFGDKTQVCRISKVIRDVNDPNNKKLRLEFRKSVMQESFTKDDDILYYSDEQGLITSTKVYKAGIRHHHPYMIKPSGTVDSDPSIKFDSTTGERTYVGYESQPGVLVDEMVVSVDELGNMNDNFNYYFRPNLMTAKIKKNSYVLANYNGKHQFVFYKGKKTGKKDGLGNDIYEDGSQANANTAYVQLNLGQAEYETFFNTTVAGSSTAKVSLNSFFGDEGDLMTDIDQIEIVCGNDNVANDKIYTVNGQLVNGKSLVPGLYIKNGKKFVVK